MTLGNSFIEHFESNGPSHINYHECPDYAAAIGLIFKWLTAQETGVIRIVLEIGVVGHRVVHGGEKFSGPVIIDNEAIRKIEECSIFAP